ncbi:Ubiquinone biosynthesis O-methyltransferase, mitochondrial [Sergentomyia squamirostris]
MFNLSGRVCANVLRCDIAVKSGFLRKRILSESLGLCYTTKTPESQDSAQKKATSLDLENIELLQKQSNKWWDPVGPLKGLHSMNHVRVPFIRDGFLATRAGQDSQRNNSGPLKGIHILEVGCGGGILTEALGRLGAKVTAIDPSEELISAARQHLKLNPELSQRITYLTDTVEEHMVQNREKYDGVVLSEVIEHVNEQEQFLTHCINSVKTGGSIFVSTFNKTFLSYVIGIFLLEDVFKILPKGTHEWEKFISPKETQKIFEKNNCSSILVHGLRFQPWNNTWHWTKSVDINYIQHAIKH